MAVAFSGVPQGRMLGPLKFLFAPLWVEGASACKLGPLAVGGLLVPGRAAIDAVGARGLRRVQGLGLGRARAHGGGLGVEAEASGRCRGRRGGWVEVR